MFLHNGDFSSYASTVVSLVQTVGVHRDTPCHMAHKLFRCNEMPSGDRWNSAPWDHLANNWSNKWAVSILPWVVPNALLYMDVFIKVKPHGFGRTMQNLRGGNNISFWVQFYSDQGDSHQLWRFQRNAGYDSCSNYHWFVTSACESYRGQQTSVKNHKWVAESGNQPIIA